MRDDLFFTLEKDFDTCENMENTLLKTGKCKVILDGKLVDADGVEYGETHGVYLVMSNPDPKPTLAALKAVREGEYVRTTPPEHSMMQLFSIF